MTVKKIGRLEFQIVPGSEQLFTSDFAEFLIAAYDKFSKLIIELRQKRKIVLSNAIKKQIMPNFLANSDIFDSNSLFFFLVQAKIFAPLEENFSKIFSPIPRLQPVIIAVFFFKSIILQNLLLKIFL